MARHRFTKKDRQKAKRARKHPPKNTATKRRAYLAGYKDGYTEGLKSEGTYGNSRRRKRGFFRRR